MNNGTNGFILNESKLNETISSISGTESIWNIIGSSMLVNVSGVLDVNRTKLNETIDAKISELDLEGEKWNITGSPYLINESGIKSRCEIPLKYVLIFP